MLLSQHVLKECQSMSTNHEIEFKQLLTASQYDDIRQKYFQNVIPFSQTNFYIDTSDFKLKANHSALRIRVKDDSYELTLKVPATVGLTEYNHSTNLIPEIGKTLTLQQFPEDIQHQLMQFDITDDELNILGSLTTHRMEVYFKHQLLVLDHSEYLGTEDYELEFEVNDYEQGKQIFLNFLQKCGIDYVKPKNKVQRFFDYKAQ